MIRRPNPQTLIADSTDVIDFGGRVASVAYTIGAKVANVRAITIQLKDGQGKNLTSRAAIELAVLADANGDAFATTGGTTGIALAVDGAVLPIVAKKLFRVISEANGSITLTWTDTASEVAFLAVMIAGRLFISTTLA